MLTGTGPRDMALLDTPASGAEQPSLSERALTCRTPACRVFQKTTLRGKNPTRVEAAWGTGRGRLTHIGSRLCKGIRFPDPAEIHSCHLTLIQNGFPGVQRPRCGLRHRSSIVCLSDEGHSSVRLGTATHLASSSTCRVCVPAPKYQCANQAKR